MINVDYIKRKLNQKSQVSNQIKSLRGFKVNFSERHGEPVRVNTVRVVWKGCTLRTVGGGRKRYSPKSKQPSWSLDC